MTIVVGYVPRSDGLAALEVALAEAERHAEPLVVVNAGADADPRGVGRAQRGDIESMCAGLVARGVPVEVRQPSRGLAPADELLEAVRSCDARLLVVGLRDGTRSRSGGGTAVRLLVEADCDVLVSRFRRG
ncbi:universal stress protein [Arthrobacter sp. NEB 688]|uniref:universal stress protein n=1 Tax=Arthrobacter sp. NEB 688 TaxID=904039 RepID=UPI0015650260|nr:universal stress protein [Arthrobacter sp. NEB 688]QKE82922.1 universal stress protein [Arthrobacter sp. NEB 688]